MPDTLSRLDLQDFFRDLGRARQSALVLDYDGTLAPFRQNPGDAYPYPGVAEVLQEILHRYIAVNRREAIQPAFDALLAFADEVLPIEQSTVEDAKQIVLGYRQLSARDAIHLAVMRQHAIGQILSFDTGFDSFPGINRIS